MPVGARRFHEAAFRGGTAGWMDVRWWFMDRLPFLLQKHRLLLAFTPFTRWVSGTYVVCLLIERTEPPKTRQIRFGRVR